MKRYSVSRWPRLAVAGCFLAATAHAQLRLPAVTLPPLPAPPLSTVPQTLAQAPLVQQVRAAAARELLRRHPQQIEADPAGEPVRRAELLWLSPEPAALDAARGEGFAVLRDASLPELGVRQLVLRPPAGLPTAQALARLRALDPGADADYNHLYAGSGQVAEGPAGAASAPERPMDLRVGLIDGGLDRRHGVLRLASVRHWGCDGGEVPSEHGTAVASLLVGRERAFRGVQPSALLYAADVYCGQPAGGAVEDIGRALAWMVRERVPVINISLVGPPNRLLERATAALLRQGHIVVAAVGNDGPAAAPLYPASYPGVVGVTGVTAQRRVLPEAAQGPQVMFAAPGADLAVARAGGGYVAARGTSFAAPFVAGLLAQALREPSVPGAAAALAQLAADAVDLGEPGRDTVYGYGLVGEAARVAPERVHAQDR